MNRNILLAILAIVIIIAVGFFVFSQPSTTDGKINTQISILSQSTLHNGEQVQFELKESSGKVLAGQNVLIDYDDGSGNVQKYYVVTDQNGKGYLTISGEAAGKYDVTITYNGTDKLNGCSSKVTITVEDTTDSTTASTDTVAETDSNASANTVMYNNPDNTTSSNYPPSSSSQSYYDADLNVYYDSNGYVIGGQEPGVSIYELRNRPSPVPEGT